MLSPNALIAADRVLIPVSADYLSLQGVERLERALGVLETKLKRTFERRIVVTRFDGRRRLSGEIDSRTRALFGDNVCATRITENVIPANTEIPVHPGNGGKGPAADSPWGTLASAATF